jgi:hypothetical protein
MHLHHHQQQQQQQQQHTCSPPQVVWQDTCWHTLSKAHLEPAAAAAAAAAAPSDEWHQQHASVHRILIFMAIQDKSCCLQQVEC